MPDSFRNRYQTVIRQAVLDESSPSRPGIGSVTYQGVVCLYACAGRDIAPAVESFGSLFDTFLFADIAYSFTRERPLRITGWEPVAGSRLLQGPASSQMQHVGGGRFAHRHLEPAWLRRTYRNTTTQRTIEIVLRRGFAEYALHEVARNSLGMFLHRGDSRGEGGSGTTFLGNRPRRHAPLADLLNVLKRKLRYPALVGSDGSNTPIPQLKMAAGGDDSFSSFDSHGLTWVRASTLEGRPGRRTVLWRVTESRCH